MKREPPLFRITEQGAPVLNRAWIVQDATWIVALEIDLRSKHCAIAAYSGDDKTETIWLGTTEESLHLHQRKKRDALTGVTFPRWADWEIFAADISRYTLRVCLVKRVEPCRS
jgi:hypothetical protein